MTLQPSEHPLRRLRLARGLRLEDLAGQLTEVSTAQLSRVENYKQAPSWDLVAQLKEWSDGALSADDFLPEAVE